MKKLLLITFLLISVLSFCQSPGKYHINKYQVDDGYSAVQDAKNSTVDLTTKTIKVKVGTNSPFIYTIIEKEVETNKTVFTVNDSEGRLCQFIFGKKTNYYLIMYSDPSGSVFYFCGTVDFY